MKDNLGDRMKFYEDNFGAGLTYLMPRVPAIVRLGGRSFSGFTKDMEKPYDKNMVDLMRKVVISLIDETNAVLGYTQSDEISLILYPAENYFGGRVQKINSVLASTASVYFNKYLPEFFPDKINNSPVFDCRSFSVPNKIEATNCILWREQDATKNSINSLARHHFSHKQLQGLNGRELQELLWKEKGINWNDEPSFFKRGSYFKKIPVELTRYVTGETFVRNKTTLLDIPKLSSIVNRVEVLFDGVPLEISES